MNRESFEIGKKNIRWAFSVLIKTQFVRQVGPVVFVCSGTVFLTPQRMGWNLNDTKPW